MIHGQLVMTVRRTLTHKLTSRKAWVPFCGAAMTCRRHGDRVRGVFMTSAYAGRRAARQDDEGGVGWTFRGGAPADLIDAFPDLQPQDIEQALHYAAESVRQREIPIREAS